MAASTVSKDSEGIYTELASTKQDGYSTLGHTTLNSSRAQHTERLCKPCPEGWEQFSSKCYYFSTEGKSWMNSHRDCLRRGADLVIIESDEEQAFINKYMRDFNWIGLSDLETERIWLWVDGTLLQKNDWESGEPDNHYNLDSVKYSGADCAITYPGENVWLDVGCHLPIPFICETDALLL
ncbi:CD209 antigen-like protein D [Conger conger]|uniref:CD209 antigen-like protein D n=1 Tax=Conger conger TaxID=82655 RepID=UPI002A5A7DC9|nr:CD209 antigen-like protein D [Conger conger]